MKWFYNGTFMSDGTPMTVAARSEVEETEFMARGFRPVKPPARKGRGTRKAGARKKGGNG